MTNVLPALSVLFAVLAAAVPWGLPANATFILPLVVVMMVFCWRTIPGVVLPTYVAMLLGLLADIMSGGPIGFWALMTLIGATAGSKLGSLGERRDLRTLWITWALLAAALGCFGWLLASIYVLRWIDWWPIAFGALGSIMLFPVVLYGLLWIRHGRLGVDRGPLYRSWT
ncbi:MAG: hypothetical protein ACREDO_05370 [Methyloceanibacter sp.]